MAMKFVPKTTDYELSPYTGLTRESWIEATEYVIDGIFKNIKSFDDPVVMPRIETEITYPHKNSPPGLYEVEKRASAFEGLARSFFFGSVLLCNKPDYEVNGYKLADYYRKQILRSATPGDPLYVGNYEELQKISGTTDLYRPFQQTVETCALVIGLWIAKEAVWDKYSKEEKDIIAAFLSSFGHANTVPQNWRLFNMLDLAFLHMNGYEIDKEIMFEHATEILNYYVGDGWYRDGHSFDYYSCWAFNVYGPLWCKWYGYEHSPELARRFEENSNKLMETYPDMFDEEGWTMMWGRSNIYRNASTSAFDGNLFLERHNCNYGLARRICSGSLLQFLGREDTFVNGVPTLGFYGQFAPLVQGYSCAESPFWMGKAFLCLHLPADHPFWTSKENNGSWDKLKDREVKCTVLYGPALCFSNHKANGTTLLRTGKVTRNTGDKHGMDNYGKLCYNSKYPWEAGPKPYDLSDNNMQLKVESMQYVLHEEIGNYDSMANVTCWAGEKDGILYRRQYFNYRLNEETTWMQAVNLADMTVPYGILRADRLRLVRCPVTYTLGAYGFPDNGTEITRKDDTYLVSSINSEDKSSKTTCAIILKGYDRQGRKKQLAMTIYDGWEELSLIKSSGTNPDSDNSIIVYAKGRRKKQYGGFEKKMMISQVITKENHEDFSEEDLFPIKEICYTDEYKTGAYGDIVLYFKSGEAKKVNFDGIEARI